MNLWPVARKPEPVGFADSAGVSAGDQGRFRSTLLGLRSGGLGTWTEPSSVTSWTCAAYGCLEILTLPSEETLRGKRKVTGRGFLPRRGCDDPLNDCKRGVDKSSTSWIMLKSACIPAFTSSSAACEPVWRNALRCFCDRPPALQEGGPDRHCHLSPLANTELRFNGLRRRPIAAEQPRLKRWPSRCQAHLPVRPALLKTSSDSEFWKRRDLPL